MLLICIPPPPILPSFHPLYQLPRLIILSPSSSNISIKSGLHREGLSYCSGLAILNDKSPCRVQCQRLWQDFKPSSSAATMVRQGEAGHPFLPQLRQSTKPGNHSSVWCVLRQKLDARWLGQSPEIRPQNSGVCSGICVTTTVNSIEDNASCEGNREHCNFDLEPEFLQWSVFTSKW